MKLDKRQFCMAVNTFEEMLEEEKAIAGGADLQNPRSVLY